MRQETAVHGRGRLGPANFRNIGAVLIVLACLHPIAVQAASRLGGGFRAGLYFSQDRPLTNKQQTALLADLRRLTGFRGIESDEEGFLMLGDRTRVVGGSPTARALISAVVDGRDSFSIESHQKSPELAFARIRAKLDYVNTRTDPGLTRRFWSVEIDFHDYQELRGQADAIKAFDPALNLLHELAHPVMHLRDSDGGADSLGDCERYINQIRRELGLAERQSYAPATERVATPYGTGQRIVGELIFVRTDPGNRTRKFRLTFDVANVCAVNLGKPDSRAIREIAQAGARPGAGR